MNYLRVLESETSNPEYYTGDQKALFLKDIKQLNVIIGANNSRKSRFMRSIINLPHKLIVESNKDFNLEFQKSNNLFQGIDSNIVEGEMVTLYFEEPQNQNLNYHELKSFFSQAQGPSYPFRLIDIKNAITAINDSILQITTEEQIQSVKTTINKTKLILTLINTLFSGFKTHFPGNLKIKSPTTTTGVSYKLPNIDTLDGGIPDFDHKLNSIKNALEYVNLLFDLKFKAYYPDMIYIPVLRSSRRISGVGINVFKDTIAEQHKMSDNSKLSIETGLDLYEKIEVARNGHRKDRENFAEFEAFISSVFFQSRPIDIIALKTSSNTDRHVKISIDDELDDIAIHDLGDGIQGIISLLLPIFTARNNAWIFIDEPENHLHPGYQNIFIKAISENEAIKSKNLKFFINTHSNHILSESLLGSLQAEILVFSKRDKFSSNITAFNENEYNTLEILGVFNTSVLISNCSIWVEGVTDRLYLRAFLRAFYQSESSKTSEPIEGFNYSFLEYAGNNLIHYNFDHEITNQQDAIGSKIKAYFVNTNIFLLADSDFANDEKHSFYEKIDRKNFKYFKTELPEIENLLPDSVLKSWLIDKVGCEETEVNEIFKSQNTGVKLGIYFDNKLTYKKRFRKFMKPNDGGTLRADYKSDLANFVYSGVNDGSITWKHLSESAIIVNLVSQLTDFIHNKNATKF